MAENETKEPIQIVNLPEGSSGPTCYQCEGPTVKTGSCHTCILCGETTGCG